MTNITLFIILNSSALFLARKYSRLTERAGGTIQILQGIICLVIWVILNGASYILIRSEGIISIIAMVIISVILILIWGILCWFENSIDVKERLKEQILQQQEDYQRHHLKEMEREQTYIRTVRHEMKNLLTAIESMAQRQDCEGILQLVRTKQGQLLLSKMKIKTGNIIVDTILNYKLPKTDMFGIDMETKLQIPTQMNVEDAVLSGILGNAIENAIEASKHIEQKDRKISVNMRVEKRNLFIEVINRYDGVIRTGRKGEILTRKGEVSNHGFGLPVIRQLVEMSRGNLDVSWDENQFFLRVILYHVI